MKQNRLDVLRVARRWPACATSQVVEALASSSARVAPVLDWLVRYGYMERLYPPVLGPRCEERAWTVTAKGRRVA